MFLAITICHLLEKDFKKSLLACSDKITHIHIGLFLCTNISSKIPNVWFSCDVWWHFKDMFYPSLGGLEPIKTSLPPLDVRERSVVSYLSTILVTRRWAIGFVLLWSLVCTVLHSSNLMSQTDLVSAGYYWICHSGIGPQLAPHAPALRDRQRQETLLLDDWNVDICTAPSMLDNPTMSN